jgi:hypothetical protein
VAVGVEEAEGEVDTEGVPGVGTWEALGDTVALGRREGVVVGEAAQDPGRVGVMVWVTEEASRLWQHTLSTLCAPLSTPVQVKSLKPSLSQVYVLKSLGLAAPTITTQVWDPPLLLGWVPPLPVVSSVQTEAGLAKM